ncbi:MAG: c-type cytochrome domain-containing protein [Planctomycetota bacterium]
MALSALLALGALLSASPAPQDPGTAAQKVDFEKQIRPLLRDHCVKCHGPDKQKGKLRLDLRRFAFDEDKGSFVPGKPDDSEALVRVKLPADDPDVMPNEGEKLNAEQIALLQRWIEEGADWPDAGDKAIEEREAHRRSRENIELPALDDAQKVAEGKALEAVRATGALAQRIAANTLAVDVNFSLQGDKIDDAALAALDGLEPTLVWLNLSRTKVTDAGLARLKRFPHLRRLNLANTAVGDAGLAALSGLSDLEYLNLYGTKVSDAGLPSLAGLKRIEKLFLWQSAATEAGATQLAQQLPGTRIDLGKEAEQMLAAAAQAKAEAEAAKAVINTKCPVSDKDVDPKFTSLLDGKTVAFCCEKCKAKFDADPNAFREKLGLGQAAVAAINAKCPVSDKDVDAAVFSEIDGKRVAFCCTKCKAKFDADPDSFRAKLGLPKK